jgi:hypothetical protein
MTTQRKEEHIRNIAFCIKTGASGYVTDNFRIDDLPTPQTAGTDLPTPQTAGTLSQQDAYARGKARIIFDAFIEQNPNINEE